MSGYIFVFDGHGSFDPDGRVDADKLEAEKRNRELEAAELAFWQTKPERFAGYDSDKGITTWLGTVIGHVVSSSTYRNNFGVRIRCVTVRGTNGATYHGRYGYDWSQLVRLRKARA